MVTQDERDRARYEDRLKAELDARSFESVMKETGHREVLTEQIHWCQRLLQQPQTPPGELLNLPAEELRRLKESLEQQLAERLPPT